MAVGQSPPSSEATASQRLLLAAEEIFAEQGYASASVREITRRAGVNVAAVNYHFGDKEQLYVECLKVAHACADGGRDEGPPEWPAGTPAVEKLCGFIRLMVARMHAPARPTALQLLMREFAHPSAAAREVILRYTQPKAFALRDILAELLPGADPRHTLMIGFSVIGQVLFYRQNRPVAELMFGPEAIAALDADTVAEHILRFTLAALGLATPYPAKG